MTPTSLPPLGLSPVRQRQGQITRARVYRLKGTAERRVDFRSQLCEHPGRSKCRELRLFSTRTRRAKGHG